MTDTICTCDSFSHPLVSVAGVRERLQALGASPNKALGQNFLIQASARDAMCAGIAGMPVYEIGPGLGALTEGLLRQSCRVLAVEKDAALAHALQAGMQHPNLQVLHKDALLVEEAEIQGWLGAAPALHAAGNLPYYITTPLALKLLCSGLPITGMTLMVQQEAAARFTAAAGGRAYGPLAVLNTLAFHTTQLLRLSPADFWPQPGVYSVVLQMEGDVRRIPPGLPGFLQAAFAMRRKTLVNNMVAAGQSKSAVLAALEALGCKEDVRAEALPPETLLRLHGILTAP